MQDAAGLVYDGPNAALVNEVITFARGDGVFSGAGDRRACRFPVRVVTGLRRAVDAAGGVGRIGVAPESIVG